MKTIEPNELIAVFGQPSKDGGILVKVKPPYPLFYGGKPVSVIRCHPKIADAIKNALQKTLNHYGSAKIKELRLDVYDGCHNYRQKRGGTSLSVHSWGCAFDFDRTHNDLKMDKTKAAFARPEYAPFLQFFREEGLLNLGEAKGYDFMHFEPIPGFFR